MLISNKATSGDMFFVWRGGGKFRISILASLGIIPGDNRNRNLLVLYLYLEKPRHGE